MVGKNGQLFSQGWQDVSRIRRATGGLFVGSFLFLGLLSAAWTLNTLREYVSRFSTSSGTPWSQAAFSPKAPPLQLSGRASILLVAFPTTDWRRRSDDAPLPESASLPDPTGFMPEDGNEPVPAESDDLVPGYVALNPSSVMRVGVPNRVMVRILRAYPLTHRLWVVLTEGLVPSDDPRRGGDPIVKPLDLSDAIILRLQGDDFTIEAQMPEKQAVGHGPVIWLWVVTPRRSGLKPLTLCASVEIHTREGFAPSTRACPFDGRISVQANPVFSAEHFWTTNLSWLGGSLVTTVVAIGGSWLRRSRRGKYLRGRGPRHSFKTPAQVLPSNR